MDLWGTFQIQKLFAFHRRIKKKISMWVINRHVMLICPFTSDVNFVLYWGVGGVSTRVWSQGLVLANQKLYHLSCSPSTFCFVLFWDRASLLCWDQPRSYSPICTSRVAEVDWSWLRWGLTNSLPRLASNLILPISVSWVTASQAWATSPTFLSEFLFT
jgi:hypothetical protein